MDKDNVNLEFANQKINDVGMEKEVKTSFIQYAMSVIMARALPDVRDGLKPVHRRILYAMYEGNHTYDKPFYKSASTVGDVLGHYHPHGDASVYYAMVRLAQPFSMRYTLIEGHGNFGNIDGDQPAAYRYTEARLSRMADSMLTDIDKNTVDFVPNFDNKLTEPSVLPARFPNLLINGSVGIAVGMATNIPPHNLGEVVDGVICVMDNPDAALADIMQFIKGPDFPTAATICGNAGILEAYTTGRGRITVRSKAEVDDEHHRIIVTEIPYQVNKANLVESMAECVKDKRIDGVTEIRDETGRDGLRIVVEYRRDANGQVILNQFYKFTQLQDTFAANMLALVDNVPKTLSLKQMIEYYIAHQESVVRRRVQFDLNKAIHDAHIFEGYKIAIDNIDRVIEIIRGSDSIPDAKAQLCEEFSLSDEQSQAIVDMTLGRLSGLERQKIEDRLTQLYAQIAEYQDILANEGRIKEIIKTDLLDLKKRYSDDRRTEIVPVEDEIILEDLIERHTCVITMTHAGYIKRQPSDVYKAQGRGGKGIIGMATKDEDFVEYCLAADSHAFLLLFSNLGTVYVKKAYMIPEAVRTSKGSNIVNILALDEGEKITAMITVHAFPSDEYLTMVTKKGLIKRTFLSEFAPKNRLGKRAIRLDDDDELVFVRHTSGRDNIIIASADGQAIRFSEEGANSRGRNAGGVKGIRLDENDYVVGACIADDEHQLFVITERGYGKRVDFSDFRVFTNRGGGGVRCHDTDRTGRVAAIGAVKESDDIMVITSDGTVMRTPVSAISVQSRTAGGVIIMRPDEDSEVVGFAVIREEVDEKELAESEAAVELGEKIEGDDAPEADEVGEPFEAEGIDEVEAEPIDEDEL